MASAAQGIVQEATPAYRLYDPGAISLAALFGGPVAGTSLMALNYRRLGQAKKGPLVLLLGALATGLLVLIGWNLPHAATSPIALIALLAIARTARSLQGPAVSEHVAHGGKLASKWVAFGFGIACFAAFFSIVYFAVILPKDGSKIVIGSKDDVYYSGSATKDEALALGNYLKTNGYFSDRGSDVFLKKGAEGTVISFVAKEGTWNEPGIVSSFEELGREAAPYVGGFPLRVRLINRSQDVKLESIVGKVDLAGNDTVYYFGSATEAQARALGEALQKAHYLERRQADVFFSKHGDGNTIAFVVGEDGWSRPAAMKEFERIVREAAPAVGGLPLTLRLVNSTLEIKKEERIS